MKIPERKPRDILVQWTSEEADYFERESLTATGSCGSKMKHVHKDDRLFICSTSEDEVYLLGALLVTSVNRRKDPPEANGESVCGPFRRHPLGDVKWNLTFQSDRSPSLKKNKSLTWQLRSHRSLTPESAQQLIEFLGKDAKIRFRDVAYLEGERRLVKAMKPTRNRLLREQAKKRYGTECYCCGFDFGVFYGDDVAGYCQIHHLVPIADGARETNVENVCVVCANCHQVLHMTDPPTDINTLRKKVRKKWTPWSDNGISRR